MFSKLGNPTSTYDSAAGKRTGGKLLSLSPPRADLGVPHYRKVYPKTSRVHNNTVTSTNRLYIYIYIYIELT